MAPSSNQHTGQDVLGRSQGHVRPGPEATRDHAAPPPIRHFRCPVEVPVRASERDHVTFLWGGLTARHEALITAGMESLGYRVELIPTPTKADYQTGREYGNVGMCSPAYFTMGALINYLKRLRDVEGAPTEEIIRDYAFFTAGSLGPCRFGMYESEYRLALRNSGFDGFRVLLFQQKGGLNQSGDDEAVNVNAQFVVTLLNGVLIGDILNELANQIRPYEVEPGTTDRVFDRVVGRLCDRLHRKPPDALKGAAFVRALSALVPGLDAGLAGPIVDHVLDDYYLQTLRECAAMIDNEIEVDFTRPKPLVKVTGEFWAQLTEGDGNYRMFSFLESQGAEVLVEPLTTWANYLCDMALCRRRDARGGVAASGARGGGRFRHWLSDWAGRARIAMAVTLLNREYDRVRRALGSTTHPQVDQATLRRLAQPFVNCRLSGGEGHMEVSKTLYYTTHRQAHMVLSLKPFGCLPSTQSDGIQVAVLSRYPATNFVSIETSGEGDVNAYSRVQMALSEAKAACHREFAAGVAATRYSLEDIRAYCAAHRDVRRPLQRVPRREGVCGKAANFVRYVASCMDKEPEWRGRTARHSCRAAGHVEAGEVGPCRQIQRDRA